MTTLLIHHQDLRIHDNSALYRNQNTEIVPVFVNSPSLSAWLGSRKQKFLLQGVNKLANQYKNNGGQLIYRQGPLIDSIKDIADETGVEKIIANNHLDPVFLQLAKRLRKTDLTVEIFQDRTAKNLTRLNSDYESFSRFYDDWKKLESPGSRDPEGLNYFNGSVDADSLPDVTLHEDVDTGEEAAKEKWTKFKQRGLCNYKDQRNNVANSKGVSKLSKFINAGMIGPRRLLNDIERSLRSTDGSEASNISKFKYELGWREFFQHVKLNNPKVVWQNHKELEEKVNWRNDPEEFQKWCQGQTGFPFVDAGMREMLRTGYMHNRTRQNVASFLTKHLLIDWRWGESYFRKKLIDYDTANNNGGWQWTASTGTDSVPNRIFNPVKQGRKYDPEATYIKKNVPELRSLDADEIHNWVKMSEDERQSYDIDYPKPIINMNKRYHEAKKVFSKSLGLK